MQTKLSLAVVVLSSAAFLATSPTFAKPPGAPHAGASPVQQLRKPTPIALPVTGLSEANAGKVAALLESLTRKRAPAWICPKCQSSAPRAGTCATCQAERVEAPVNVSLVREVKCDTVKGSVSFALAPGESLSLDELARALRATEVGIVERELPLPPFVRVAVALPTDTPGADKALRDVLEAAQLFERVDLELDKRAPRATAVLELGAKPVTLGSLTTEVAKLGAEYRVAGLTWLGPCPACAKLGHKSAACVNCARDAQPVPPSGA